MAFRTATTHLSKVSERNPSRRDVSPPMNEFQPFTAPGGYPNSPS